jgi:Spy/CpxP family protein refolding chaperone
MKRTVRSVTMSWSGIAAIAVVLLAGVAGTACGSGSAQPNTASGAGTGVPVGSAAVDDDFSPEANELRSFHRHHHMGFIGFALVSIPSLGVTPAEQVAVDKIRADIQAKMQPAHDAEAALLTVVADGLAAGAIDQAKVDAAIAKITEVSTQMDDVTNDALNQLHAALSAPERQALALKIQAHYQLWEKANANEAAQPDQEKEGGHIHHLATVLALTPDQVQKIDAAFTASMASVFAAHKFDAKSAEEHLDKFTKGFVADQFDAKTLVTADKANSGVTSWGAMRMVKMYDAMLPVLTPDQRTKLAALLREHATKTELK